MADFERFVEVIEKKESKRVVGVTVRPIVEDCTGAVWFTDLMLQEGDMLSGYTHHTKGFLKKSENAPVWFNGVVRSKETVILANLGGTSAGLDIHLYPKQEMAAGSVTLAQGAGGQKVSFPAALAKDADLALLASTRECTLNGRKAVKDGFFQYSAAWDSKHIVTLEEGKSARLLFSMQEMEDGGVLL